MHAAASPTPLLEQLFLSPPPPNSAPSLPPLSRKGLTGGWDC